MDSNQIAPVAAMGTPVSEPAEEPAEEQTGGFRSQAGGLLWEIAQTVVLTVIIFFAVRTVVQNFRVEGASMDPTLHGGQYLLINKMAYLRSDGSPVEWVIGRPTGALPTYVTDGPRRGDIVVFKAPNQSDKDFIKRVIALPGETVRIVNGRVFVNGRPLDEPYIKNKASYDMEQKVVPAGQYFVLGDNRPNSSDSHLGWYVPANNLIGKAWVSYWPPTYWGVVPAMAYEQ